MPGSVKRRPNGKWRARFRPSAHEPEESQTYARKADADNWLAEKMTASLSGSYVNSRDGRRTLAEFYSGWSEDQIWATNTRLHMDLSMRSCTFADMPLSAVRKSHVERWVKTMSLTLAPKTIETRFRSVRTILAAAIADRVLATDPSLGVKLPRQRRAEHAMRVPTSDEVGAVLRAADPAFAPLIGLAAFAGLRLGEAAGVQVGDVDFLRRTLHVRRQVLRAQGPNVEITPPKHGSERDVFLPDDLVQMLARHVETTGAKSWLFRGTSAMSPPHQNTVGYRWRATIAASGVKPFRLHDCRHHFASGLIAAGCDVVTVQRALGHSNASTTLRVYSHLWPGAEDRTRDAAAGLLTAALGTNADQTRTQEA